MAGFILPNLLDTMKKLFLLSLIFIPQFIHACSTCNVEYSEAEKRGFIIATLLLIITPFLIGFLIYKYILKNYQNEN